MSNKIRNMVFIAVSVALITICSWIAVPSAIPVTLQTFAIFTVLGLLGGKNGTAAVTIYVIMGAIGVPVFSHFKGGLPIILHDVAGGYIIGFIAMALFFWLAEVYLGRSATVKVISMVMGLLLCYAVGTLWYIKINLEGGHAENFWSVASACVVPFIIPDTFKLATAVLVIQKVGKHIKSS